MSELVGRNSHFGPTSSSISTSYEQMMGPLQYSNFLSHDPVLPPGQNLGFQRTNSVFSDHISICENYLRQSFSKSGEVMNLDHARYVFCHYFFEDFYNES